MSYTFAPGDLVVFHCADVQRTPLLGVTILYAVLWCYYGELMFACQHVNSVSLFIACKFSNLGFWATEIHSTIPWSFSLFRSATKANPTFLPLYAAFSITYKPQHTAVIFRSEIGTDFQHFKRACISCIFRQLSFDRLVTLATCNSKVSKVTSPAL